MNLLHAYLYYSTMACVFLFIGCKSSVDRTILIQHATVIDGSDTAAYSASIRIKDKLIIAIGDLEVNKSDTVIDATGLIVSPGFIDTHSHHDEDTLRTITAAISQGITTIIVGQDGFSNLSLASYFDSISRHPLALNIGTYVGHNSIREAVMGHDAKRAATEDEIAKMKAILKAEMDNGALGLSTGLEYDTGIYSDEIEVIELARETAKRGGRYISHMRSEDIYLEESIDEIIEIGRSANIPVQISHFKLGRKGLWGQAPRFLAKLDSARSLGINITADVYPYEYWQSTMTVLFPNRDFDNRDAASYALTELTSPDGMIIGRFNAMPSYEGLTLAAIAEIRHEDPVTTYMRLIQMSQEVPGESIIAKAMDLEDIKILLSWPYANLCSDGGPSGHPRGWGAFPRYLNMDNGQSLEQKIHKTTGQSAENIALDSIGYIREGYYADLVLFDPKLVKDNATYAKSNLKASGIKLVIVSGEVVYKDNRPTMAYPGRVIMKRKS